MWNVPVCYVIQDYKPTPLYLYLSLQCQPDVNKHSSEPAPTKAWEGEGTDICTYYVTFPSPYACPTQKSNYKSLSPKITAGKSVCLNFRTAIKVLPSYFSTTCKRPHIGQVGHNLNCSNKPQDCSSLTVCSLLVYT